MSVDEKGIRPTLVDTQLLEQHVIDRHVAQVEEPDPQSSKSGDNDDDNSHGVSDKKKKAAEGSIKDFVVRPFFGFFSPTHANIL
jgi:hypothetical protein